MAGALRRKAARAPCGLTTRKNKIPKIDPAMNTSNTTSPRKVTRHLISIALTLGLFGALFALTPPAIGQVGGRNHATNLAATPPVPTHIIQPKIDDRYVGIQVMMTFWVDKSGRPYGVGCNDLEVDRSLVTTLSQTLAFWKFTPAKDADGNPVARRVTLPVNILPARERTGTLIAFGQIK
jgi:hypothetical protein